MEESDCLDEFQTALLDSQRFKLERDAAVNELEEKQNELQQLRAAVDWCVDHTTEPTHPPNDIDYQSRLKAGEQELCRQLSALKHLEIDLNNVIAQLDEPATSPEISPLPVSVPNSTKSPVAAQPINNISIAASSVVPSPDCTTPKPDTINEQHETSQQTHELNLLRQQIEVLSASVDVAEQHRTRAEQAEARCTALEHKVQQYRKQLDESKKEVHGADGELLKSLQQENEELHSQLSKSKVNKKTASTFL